VLKKQIKSKERVANYGEVNTSEKEINSMLDLVKQETERYDSRFLEPACGDGNFLIKVLDRKLKILQSEFKKNQFEFEKNLIVIIGSIYGIDLLNDNVTNARERLFTRSSEVYKKYFKDYLNFDFINSISFILKRNIINGDALTLKRVDSEDPIIFSEWSLIKNKVKRRDFNLSDLVDYSDLENNSLFSSMGVSITQPIKEFDLLNYDKLFKYAE
tara:strand:+ start:316 stop:960 length:645 start_codon:yes stop_codon:yes gene_type:complete